MTTSSNHISVSVVMAVYDEIDNVRITIESVFAQQDIELEFLVVSDGASTEVQEYLESIDDSRFKLIYQDHAGLTRALIKACNMAKNPLIARIDAGDIMLEGRLSAQAKMFTKRPSIVLVACWVRVETDEGYYLYTVNDTSEQIDRALRAIDLDDFKTPFHSSTMFRKSAYQQVGGYRWQFYFAQDADLWSRMLQVGDFFMLEKTLTKAIFSVSGISGRYNKQQQALKELVVKANALRHKDQNDDIVLNQAEQYRPDKENESHGAENEFDTVYFLAKVMHDQKSPHAREYWYRALKLNPWSLKVWGFTVLSFFFAAKPSV